ncbi:MAG: ParA family protein [Anaerovoracaceae bacterium]
MKIIAIANQKGGVGKTTTTLNFGISLAEEGFKVLLIDFDHQANLTLGCGIKSPEALAEVDTIAEPLSAVIEDRQAKKLQIFEYRKNVCFMASNEGLSRVNLMLVQSVAREFVLKAALENLKKYFDYILIDCAPSLSVDLINALTAADEVLIVSNPAKFSTSGTYELVKTVSMVHSKLNNNIRVAGLLFNKVDRRTNFACDVIEKTRADWKGKINIFETEIPGSVRVEESQAMALPMSEYEVDNKASLAFREFTKEYLKGAKYEKKES